MKNLKQLLFLGLVVSSHNYIGAVGEQSEQGSTAVANRCAPFLNAFRRCLCLTVEVAATSAVEALASAATSGAITPAGFGAAFVSKFTINTVTAITKLRAEHAAAAAGGATSRSADDYRAAVHAVITQELELLMTSLEIDEHSLQGLDGDTIQRRMQAARIVINPLFIEIGRSIGACSAVDADFLREMRVIAREVAQAQHADQWMMDAGKALFDQLEAQAQARSDSRRS